MSYLGDCTRCGSPVSTKNPGYDPADYASDGNGRIWHRRGRCPKPGTVPPYPGRRTLSEYRTEHYLYPRGGFQVSCANCGQALYESDGLADGYYCPLCELVTEAPAYVQLPRSASPIEQQFWAAHQQLALPELSGLVPQHPAGRYRIDFALPGRRIGIELDGFASHSSTKAIASDRQRQRDLERAGWRIIRFGGSEVYHDAAECVRQAAILVRSWTEEGER